MSPLFDSLAATEDTRKVGIMSSRKMELQMKEKQMEPSRIIVIVVPYSPPPKRMSKLKHWIHRCAQLASRIPWQRLADSFRKGLLRLARWRLVAGTAAVRIVVGNKVKIEIKVEITVGILGIVKIVMEILSLPL